ncbi:hypothetical protein DL89DRAFT_264133 [Linderina pennispora]|uniref:Uncharacterized protein n=1 Tax=Linderina pennispora TaxID=61395 RepID=A0A1Y1WLY3_9FUNG|nr:uncharacterized protein DL89DRAFT_264133 [Linderina pennispora]ORX74196.1 hypothetical protein DL89DRAFT_264133 [Linderina pennispora]
MSRPQRPSDLSHCEQQRRLRMLSKQAHLLDNRLGRCCSGPDTPTVVSFIPVIGGITTSMDANDFLDEIMSQFVIPTYMREEMKRNISKHLIMSLVPVYGWIARSIFKVNRRNYKLLRNYIKESKP